MKSMKALQAKVNEISKGLGGIDTPTKLLRAKAIAVQDEEVKGLLLDILNEALTRKWQADTAASVEAFLETAAHAREGRQG
jgi:hypothetical protein